MGTSVAAIVMLLCERCVQGRRWIDQSVLITCALEVQGVPRFRWLVFLPGHLHSTGVQSCELGGHIPLGMLVTLSGVLIG